MKRLVALLGALGLLGGGVMYGIGYFTERKFISQLPLQTQSYQRGVFSADARQNLALPPTLPSLPREFELQHHIQHQHLFQPTRIDTQFNADQTAWLKANTVIHYDGSAVGTLQLPAQTLQTGLNWAAGQGDWQFAQGVANADFYLPAAAWRTAQQTWQLSDLKLVAQFQQQQQDSQGSLDFEGFHQRLGSTDVLGFQEGRLSWTSHHEPPFLDAHLSLQIKQLQIADQPYHSAELTLHLQRLDAAAWQTLLKGLQAVLETDPAMRWLAAFSLLQPLQAALQGLPEITLDNLVLRDQTGTVIDSRLAFKAVAHQVPLTLLNIAEFVEASGQLRIADSLLQAIATWSILTQAEPVDNPTDQAQRLLAQWLAPLSPYLTRQNGQYHVDFSLAQGAWQLNQPVGDLN